MGVKETLVFNNERRERVQKALSVYLSKSSVSGVSFIIGTKYVVVRIIWTMLLIIALIGMTVHLVALMSQYGEYQKQSSTDLLFSILPLPAVTFCNVNPIRMSQLHLASPELNRLVTSFDLETLPELRETFKRGHANKSGEGHNGRPNGGDRGNRTDTWMGREEDYDENDHDLSVLFDNFDFDSFLVSDWDGGISDGQSDGGGSGGGSGGDGKGGGSGTGGGDGRGGGGGGGGSSGKGGSSRRRKYCETSPCDDKKDSRTSGHQPSTMSNFRKINSVFRILYGAQNNPVRSRMGHRLAHMYLDCDVGGEKCIVSKFQRTASDAYGNCFTLEFEDRLVVNDGPSSGLDLALYLQGEEYLRAFTPSTGIQVVIHEPGTIPFPEDEGFSVAAGTHTMVGLKMQDITRLGSPHGDCSDVGDFKHKYGVAYTRQTCQKLCQTSHVARMCGCTDTRGITLSRLFNVTGVVRPCRTPKERKCAVDMKLAINKKEKRSCLCKNPCRQKKYVKTVSSRPWPNKEYAKLFVAHICGKDRTDLESECQALKQKQGDELRQEFLKLSIYYEDLNYEKLTELPSYKLVQLLCDVGGSIGLWIGLSLLSLCEVLHLVGNIIVSACCHSIKKQCNGKNNMGGKEGGEGLSETTLS